MSHFLIPIQTPSKFSQNNVKTMTIEWNARLGKKKSALKKKTLYTPKMIQKTLGKRKSSDKFKLGHNQKSNK